MKKSTRSNEIKALEKLRLPDLQAKFAEVTGEKSRSPNRTFLIRRITQALAAKASSAMPEEAAPVESTPTDAAPAEAVNEEAPPEETEGAAPNAAAGEDESAAETTDGAHGGAEETRLSKLSVPELQALYLEVVGRPTGSSHKRYVELADMWSYAVLAA
jgi:hypothetical protein